MVWLRPLAVFSVIAVLGIFSISATPYVEADYDIPDWIKVLAEFWANGQIDDNTFGSAIDWLLENAVLSTPTNSLNSLPSTFTNSTGTYYLTTSPPEQ